MGCGGAPAQGEQAWAGSLCGPAGFAGAATGARSWIKLILMHNRAIIIGEVLEGEVVVAVVVLRWQWWWP